MTDGDNSGGDDRGFIGKVVLSAVVVVMAIPGLVIEPGPVSELVALGILGAIWSDGNVSEAVPGGVND